MLALRGMAKMGPAICQTLNDLADSFSHVDGDKVMAAGRACFGVRCCWCRWQRHL